MSEPRADNMKIEKYNASLKVPLTAEEIADRADRSAHKMKERDGKEEEQKAQAKHMKSIVESMDAEIRHLLGEVANKATYRQVECERQYLFNEVRYQEVRTDTGEIISSRKLLESEKQMELPFPDDKHDPNQHPPKGTPWTVPPFTESSDETWMPIPITEALPTLGKKVFEGMASLNLRTMGELLAWKFGSVERWWTDIPGLGEAGCSKIDDAIAAFFAGRSQG
jgi:hypothetical protein